MRFADAASAVHPRSRGEHVTASAPCSSSFGSSPLARGARDALQCLPGARRFIPARAGSTWGRASRLPWPAVHPRSRGEHMPGCFSAGRNGGSSPLARGAPHLWRCRRSAGRFIPARAGSTYRPRVGWTTPSVHPRSRGEHSVAPGTDYSFDRFIPARAGSTTSNSAASAPTPVHPRSRGEHTSSGSYPRWRIGSSPLARGAQHEAHHQLSRRRFIPARAGSTSTEPAAPTKPPVHPRSRGEHPYPEGYCEAIRGSSPLARGAPRRPAGRSPCRRFIPARAGSTIKLDLNTDPSTVHPRSRGEHSRTDKMVPLSCGSSPLARGAHLP